MIFDTIVLAGDKGSSRTIHNSNKTFLPINKFPLIVHILLALEKVPSVQTIYLVGPKKQLIDVINRYIPSLKETKKIIPLEQKQTVYENFWYAYNYSFENDSRERTNDYKNSQKYREKTVLVLSGDIPLVTPQEIDFFLSQCDISKYDYFAGLTPIEKLSFFYPSPHSPGIKMSYIHLKEGLYRNCNLHLIKPVQVLKAAHIQKFYEYRYQKELKNILSFITEVFKTKKNYSVMWYYGLMQLALFLSSFGLARLSTLVRALIPTNKVEKSISHMLQTRFKTIYMPYAGATLDIDNEETYKAMNCMFEKWKNYLSTQL